MFSTLECWKRVLRCAFRPGHGDEILDVRHDRASNRVYLGAVHLPSPPEFAGQHACRCYPLGDELPCICVIVQWHELLVHRMVL